MPLSACVCKEHMYICYDDVPSSQETVLGDNTTLACIVGWLAAANLKPPTQSICCVLHIVLCVRPPLMALLIRYRVLSSPLKLLRDARLLELPSLTVLRN